MYLKVTIVDFNCIKFASNGTRKNYIWRQICQLFGEENFKSVSIATVASFVAVVQSVLTVKGLLSEIAPSSLETIESPNKTW